MVVSLPNEKGAEIFTDDPARKGIFYPLGLLYWLPNKPVLYFHETMVQVEQIVVTKDFFQRDNTAIGVFITLEPPSRDMTAEAVSASFYYSPCLNQNCPGIQI